MIISTEEITGYIVSYDSGGGSGSMIGDLIGADGTHTLEQNEFGAPVGKRFSGWAVGDANAVPLRNAGEQIAIDGDTVVYAVWEDAPPSPPDDPHDPDDPDDPDIPDDPGDPDDPNDPDDPDDPDDPEIPDEEDPAQSGSPDGSDVLPAPKDDKKHGAAIWITIGAIAALVVCGLCFYLFVIRKKK